MRKPIALKVAGVLDADVHRVEIDPLLGSHLVAQSDAPAPAIIVVHEVAMLSEQSAAMIDAENVLAATAGDWSNALLIVLPIPAPRGASVSANAIGDARFLAYVERIAPDLLQLASQTIEAVRKAGVAGKLQEAAGGRWVNRPINTFTIKAQPRAGNLQFTLYGNPNTYDAAGFLLQDQNSYSRGWVRGPEDVPRFAEFARQSHLRRRRRGA